MGGPPPGQWADTEMTTHMWRCADPTHPRLLPSPLPALPPRTHTPPRAHSQPHAHTYTRSPRAHHNDETPRLLSVVSSRRSTPPSSHRDLTLLRFLPRVCLLAPRAARAPRSLVNQNDVETIRQWLQQDPNAVHMRSSDGRGPLWWAYEYHRGEIVQLLLAAGANPSLTDGNARSPRDMQ